MTQITVYCYEQHYERHCEWQKGLQYCERQTALLMSQTAYLLTPSRESNYLIIVGYFSNKVKFDEFLSTHPLRFLVGFC